VSGNGIEGKEMTREFLGWGVYEDVLAGSTRKMI
jgi:hypothetical protein